MMNDNIPPAMEHQEEQLTMLVGMGFERNVAKRAMEANSWNINDAIADLTSPGYDSMDAHQPRSSPREILDAGLSSLSVPQRQPENGEEQRASRERKSKKKSKKQRRRERANGGESETSHRENTAIDDDGLHLVTSHDFVEDEYEFHQPVSHSPPSPRQTQRTSQLYGEATSGAANDAEHPSSPCRQFNAQRISQYDATSDSSPSPATPRRFVSRTSASMNAPSSQQSKCFVQNQSNPLR